MPIDLAQFSTAVPATEEAIARPEPRAGGVDLTQFAGTAPGQRSGPQTLGQEFAAGVQRGTEQTAAMFYGLADLAGSFLGSESLRNWAQEGVAQSQRDAERVAATIASFKDIDDAGDFFDWAAGAIGEQVPNLALVFGGGGVGGVVARTTLRSAIKNELRDRATQDLRRQLGGAVTAEQIRDRVTSQLSDPATQRLLRQAMTSGSSRGAFAGSFGLNVGDIQNELTAAGIDAPGTALIGGTIAAALDAAPVTVLINRMFPGVDEALAKGFITDVAKTMGLQAVLEGSTEAAQEVVLLASRAYHDPAFDITSPSNKDRILEAAAAGALVGAVTGGTGAAASQLGARGARRLRDARERARTRANEVVTEDGVRIRWLGDGLQDFVRSKTELNRARVETEEAEADSVLPGFRELRDAASNYLNETVGPLTNRLREQAEDGVRRAREALGVETLRADVRGVVSEVENRVRRRLAPMLDEATRLMNQQISAAREQAATLAGNERVQFMTQTLERVKQDIKNFVDQRIAPLMQEAENELVDEIKTRDFDDPDAPDLTSDEFDPTEDRPDPSEIGRPQAGPRVLFGDTIEVGRASKTPNPKTGKHAETTIQVRSRTSPRRDDGAGRVGAAGRQRMRDSFKPFASRADANAAVAQVRESLPGLPEDVFEVVEHEGGFAIAVNETGDAEALFEQIRFNDGLNDARAAARLNPDARRRIGVIRPGARINERTGKPAVTRMDVPTLALAGVDILEQSGTQLPERADARLLRGLDHMIARMLDQGYTFENGFAAFQGKVLQQEGDRVVTVGQARRRVGFIPPSDNESITRSREQDAVVTDIVGPPRKKGEPPQRRVRVVNDPGPVFERGLEGSDQRVEEIDDRVQPPGETPVRATARVSKRETRSDSGELFEIETSGSRREFVRPTQERQTLTEEELARETEADQAAASRRAPSIRRPSRMRVGAAIDWVTGHRNHQVLVGLLGQPQELSQAVDKLVRELIEITGLRNRVLVVDAAGMRNLIETGHPNAERFEKTLMDDPAGRIHFIGDEAIIYVADRVLVDQKDGDVDKARLNTFRVVAHEIGHLVERVYYQKLSPELKQRMFDAFMEWAKANPNRNHSKNFDEWMANQFVAWALRDQEASDPVDSFFQRVGRILRRMYEALRSVYGLSDTYREFLNGIRDAAAGRSTSNPFTQYFLNEGVVGYGWFREARQFDTERESTPGPEGTTLVVTARTGRENIWKVEDVIQGTEIEDLEATFNRWLFNSGFQNAWAEVRQNSKGEYFVKLNGISEVVEDTELDFDMPDLQDFKPKLRTAVRKILDNYPGVRQAAVRTWQMGLWLHEQLFASLNGNLRRMGFDAANELADTLNRTPGQERENPTYFNNVQLHLSRFAVRFNRVLKNMTPEQKTAALAELIALDGKAGEHQNVHARKIREIFDDFYSYLIEAGLPVARIQNYIPRVWDYERMEADRDKILDRLVELGMEPSAANVMLDRMFERGRESEFQQNMRDQIDLPNQEFLEHRARILDDPFFQDYRLKDLDRTIERYLNSAVKRAEFNRFYGSDARRGQWNPRGKFQDMLRRARQEGASKEQLDYMRKALDTALGRHGRELPHQVRETMAWVATYQNLRLLLFATLSSFPDIVGPAIRSKSFRDSFQTIRNAWTDLVNKESDLQEMARVWGIISDTLNQHILTEHMDNHWFPERARRINEKFFRAIGLERWTNFTRAAALAVGRDAIKRWAAEGNEKNLAELGLTVEDVKMWLEGGEEIYGAEGSPDGEAERKVAEALIQFVNESVMRPNPSQRPLWASNPAFMLLFHLKMFMYSFHDTIIRQVVQNMREANTPWQKAYMVAVPGLMMMALTGLGLELRELIQYKLWGRTPRTDRMSNVEYVWELATRSGLFGPSQLAIDWEGADERGQLGVIAVAGPTVNQLNELISKPLSQSVPKAIPVVGQIPPARDLVRKMTPL